MNAIDIEAIDAMNAIEAARQSGLQIENHEYLR